MASMDSHGYLYIFPKYSQFPKYNKSLECDIVFIEGGIRNDTAKQTKNNLREVKIVRNVQQNRRLWINADAFIVRCFDREGKNETKWKMVWEKPFAGLEVSKKPKYEISKHPDLNTLNTYGGPKWTSNHAKKLERYSIDILGFDSTSRTQFMRHMPRTTEIMNKLGYHFLYGYNKVADNSMVNLAPILIGDMPEALAKPKLDESGDINLDNLLPQNDSMDPTNLKFIWNIMKEKYGCETLFNEDISKAGLGLFNYPPNEFKGGFRHPPADHYFRKYYLAIYKKWKYAPCIEGDQLQWEFVKIWRRFAHHYKDICHFGFSFITTLTHESPFVLETLDERLAGTLSEMYLEELFDNSVSIIMGDHGNRIGLVQYSYTGRIEERMPLMAIRLPNGFAEKYPKQYSNFLANKFKLTANFDIHQTLQDIVHMDFERQYKGHQRGISLFDDIPNDRTCRQLFIPENFCSCLEGVKVDVEEQKQLKTVRDWLKEQQLDQCLKLETLKIESKIEPMSLNLLSREGLRSKANVTVLEITRKKPAKNDLFSTLFFSILLFLRLKNSAIRGKENPRYPEKSTRSTHFLHHPFDNTCKFPISNIYADDIMAFDHSGTRLRTLKCNLTNLNEMATMDSHGYLYIYPKYSQYKKYREFYECDIVFIEGGIRNDTAKQTKNSLKEVKIVKNVQQNRRLWINADAFIVRCFDQDVRNGQHSERLVWEKVFAGLEDSKKPKYEISIHPDLNTLNTYGDLKWTRNHAKKLKRYSIDILAFDSTSRTQFMRHMPRTTEIMNKLGYHFLYGYNKVADNSMVNLAPILIGDMPEALAKPKLDESGDINLDNLLPQNDSLDPTNLKFIWNVMNEKYGCETLFNEDISRIQLGLFNYPPNEFQGGFRHPPADHYFRKYYLAIYKKWRFSACFNGDQLQWEFVMIWRRFAHYYRDICHFGFSFITTLTHEFPFVLETLDERLAGTLSEMYLEGLFEDSVSIIMGDHGNRIGRIQYSYTGRIEERMPLMAIRLPNGFAEKYPKQYSNFLANKFKLTANFDIHQTLQDIVHMDFERQYKGHQRGISLFDDIPNDRTCRQLFIPENFCSCLEGVKVDVEEQEQIKATKAWFFDQKLDQCLKLETLKIESKIEPMSLNLLSREGLRSKANLTDLEITRKKPPRNDYINFEFDVVVELRIEEESKIKLRIRIEKFVRDKRFRLVYEPQVVVNPTKLYVVVRHRVCTCAFYFTRFYFYFFEKLFHFFEFRRSVMVERRLNDI